MCNYPKHLDDVYTVEVCLQLSMRDRATMARVTSVITTASYLHQTFISTGM